MKRIYISTGIQNNRIIKWLFPLLLLLLISSHQIKAQCVLQKNILHNGEQINYDVYFKWGLLMPKAGTASFQIKNSRFESQNAWNHKLTFRTNGFAEKVYRMRDTLECYFSPDMRLLFSTKHSNEKNYYSTEDISFTYHKNNTVTTRTHRYTPTITKIDTTITSTGCVMDMMGAVLYLRSIDWSKLKHGDEFPLKVAIGRDIVNISFRYTGQEIVEKNESLKYRTRHFFIDIYDDAFEESKAAAEVWVGDDENHIPVKVRAKLKIGAAEVHYNSSSNLKHPFSARVVIPPR